jgi:hypothetical protein
LSKKKGNNEKRKRKIERKEKYITTSQYEKIESDDLLSIKIQQRRTFNNEWTGFY